MRSALLLLPSAVAEDTTTLLSMTNGLGLKLQTGAGAHVGEMMDSLKSRNVTQMASMMQTMVESTIAGDGVALDGDILQALDAIKQMLLGDIQAALQREHDLDQLALGRLSHCFTRCKLARGEDDDEADRFREEMLVAKGGHERCREAVYAKYVTRVEECNALDAWTASLDCPDCVKEECAVIRNPDQRNIGDMLQKHLDWAVVKYSEWEEKHAACVKAVYDFESTDADCDKSQYQFEESSCSRRQALWTSCNVNQMSCCAGCSVEFYEEVNRIECAEKDRKIDWSATKKIECYIDVLMLSPTSDELQSRCGADGKNCLNNWREAKYKACEDVCAEVDYDAGGYAVVDGVNTTHRVAGSYDPYTPSPEDRCTRHLDIDFPMMPACDKCPPPVPGPCEFAFISTYYSEYDSTSIVEELGEDAHACHPDVHQHWWAYSRAECRPCPALIGRCLDEDPSCFYGDEVKIFATDATREWLNLGEVLVNGGSATMTVTISDEYSATHNKDNCVDGNLHSFCHSKNPTGWWVSFKLDAPTCIESIEVVNRKDCCAHRIEGAGIKILNRGTDIWQDTFEGVESSYTWTLSGKSVKDDCSGWSADKRKMIGDTCHIGAFDNNNQRVTKSFSGLSGGCHYKWSAVIDTYASVDNEPMIFSVNKKQFPFQSTSAACGNGWSQHPLGFGKQLGSLASGRHGWKDCYKNFEAEFVAPANGKAEVDMYMAINQNLNDEGWGWHNMEFEMLKCGTIVDDCSGWSVGATKTISGTCYMGAFDQHHKKVAKTFSGLSPGCTYKWTAVIDTYASVDNEDMVFTVNGQANMFKSRPATSCNNGWTHHTYGFGKQLGSGGSGQHNWQDCYKNFEASFVAPKDGKAHIQMYMGINQHINDEAWGWHDMVLEKTTCKPVPSRPTEDLETCKNGEIMTKPPALSGGCQRCTCAAGRWQCACSLRHRKEINDLTDEEFVKFAEALNKLKAEGTWANISMVHLMSDSQNSPGGRSHGSPLFLPWHRKLFIEVESRLQIAANDCSVSIPYWNWALEIPNFLESKIFQADRLGSLNADLQEVGQVEDMNDMCVKDGAFGSDSAGSQFGHKDNELGSAINSGRGSDCIMRAGRAPSAQSYATILSTLEEPSLGINEFEQMSNYVERDLHNFFHGAIGGWKQSPNGWAVGHMSGFVSPYDPMFFMHHGFVDFLWSKWQAVHVEETDRLHRSGDLMMDLLFDGQTDVFPVSDISMNMDILDDDPETEDTQEKACVVYHERHHGDNACAADWNHIQACLSKVVKAERLHEVPRIKETTSVGDVCSPLNAVQTDLDRMWLETMSEMGMLDKDQVPVILQWESTINKDISARTPTMDAADANECEKRLCFSTQKLFEICGQVESSPHEVEG
jgi:tyrosinase